MILLLDNYDSFTYNIVQYLEQLQAEVQVYKNDSIRLADIEALQPKAIVLGPGPGTPSDAGVTLACIHHFAAQIPMLGVCLGHQAIAQAFGAQVIHAPQIMHGRTSNIYHQQIGVFKGLPTPTKFTRYHSLIVDKDTLPETLEVTAWTQYAEHDSKHISHPLSTDIKAQVNEVMGIRHKQLPIEGVQFHPESILSEAGLQLFNNFLTAHDLL